MRRVVVTGLGVVAPNGVGKDAFWRACVGGHSGIGPIRSFDASNHPCGHFLRTGGASRRREGAAASDRMCDVGDGETIRPDSGMTDALSEITYFNILTHTP